MTVTTRPTARLDHIVRCPSCGGWTLQESGVRTNCDHCPDEAIVCATNGTKASAERNRVEREYLFEEVRYLISYGTAPNEIVERLGTTRVALERRALRWGARDIAHYVRPTQSRGRCATCGGTTRHARTRQCRPCFDAAAPTVNEMKFAA